MLRYTSVFVAAAFGLVATFAEPAKAQAPAPKPLVLKGQSTHPASANFHLIFKLWAETVEKMSGGRLKIETLPAGAIVPPFEVFDATSKNVLDVGMAPFGYILGRNTATIPMSHGPLFGMDGSDYWAWYYDGGGMALLEEFYRDVLKLNVVGFPIPTDYPQGMGWFKKEINSLADLKGLKYRIYGIGAETYGRLGVSVVTIPGGEIVPAMERGVIDAFEFNNPTSDRRFGAQNVAKNYMLGSHHQATEYFEIMINRTKFEGLAKEQQAIIQYAAEAASSANEWKAMDQYSKDLQELISKEKVNVVRTPQGVFDAQIKAWDGLIAQLGSDPFMKKVMDSQKEWVRRVVYYNTLNATDYVGAFNHHFPGVLKKA